MPASSVTLLRSASPRTPLRDLSTVGYVIATSQNQFMHGYWKGKRLLS
jgi:hypothetical protein